MSVLAPPSGHMMNNRREVCRSIKLDILLGYFVGTTNARYALAWSIIYKPKGEIMANPSIWLGSCSKIQHWEKFVTVIVLNDITNGCIAVMY